MRSKQGLITSTLAQRLQTYGLKVNYFLVFILQLAVNLATFAFNLFLVHISK